MTPDEVVANCRPQLEALALKIVKQVWLKLGVTPTAQLTKDAANRIATEHNAWLVNLAAKILDDDRLRQLREAPPHDHRHKWDGEWRGARMRCSRCYLVRKVDKNGTTVAVSPDEGRRWENVNGDLIPPCPGPPPRARGVS